MSKILFPEGFHSGMVTSLSSPGVMPDGTGKVNQGGLQVWIRLYTSLYSLTGRFSSGLISFKRG